MNIKAVSLVKKADSIIGIVKKTNNIVSKSVNMKSGCDSYRIVEERESGTITERFFSKTRFLGKYVQKSNGDWFRNYVDATGKISHIEIFYADLNRSINVKRESNGKFVTNFISGIWV